MNPSPSALTEMIECAGGIVEKRRRYLRRQLNDSNQDGRRFVLISVKEDMHLLVPWFPPGLGKFCGVNNPFLLCCFMYLKDKRSTGYLIQKVCSIYGTCYQ